MELRQLRYFIAIVKHGSISRAAQAVNVAQSALSHQLSLLEQELGTRLLHRMPRGTTMTEAGYIFYAHALSVIRRIEDATLSVHGSLGTPSGKVSLGVPSSVCSALASPLLQAVRRELPQVELEMSEQASGALATQLQSGSVDLAVLFDDADLSRCIGRPIVEEVFYYISRDPIPDAENGFVTLDQALDGPLVLASQQQGVRRIVEAQARQHGVKQPDVVAELNSVSILRAAVMAGIGNTILPPMSLWQELESGTLHGCPIGQPILKRKVYICASAVIPMTSATLALFDLIARLSHHLANSGAWVEAAPTEPNSLDAAHLGSLTAGK